MEGEPRSSGTGRLISVVAWTLLLLGLWLWGREVTESGLAGALSRAVLGGGVPQEEAGPAAPADGLPPRAAPLPGSSVPRRVEIASLGVQAGIVERAVDETGGVAPPPFTAPQLVGWYAGGPVPGAAGAAVLVGHVDTETRPAVFYALSTVEPGSEVRVTRADGTVAEFTVSAVDVVERSAFDAGQVYGPRAEGTAELRLITCGGTFDAEQQRYSANVVVSAYLTGGTRR